MKGLSHQFNLENGKFLLTSDSEKAVSNLRFFAAFFDFFRVYNQAYVFNTLRFIQKPETYLSDMKTSILFDFNSAVTSNVKGVKLNKSDLVNLGDKTYGFFINYSTYPNETNTENKLIFI